MLLAVADAPVPSNTTQSQQTPIRQRTRCERPGSRTVLNQRYVLERTCEITKRDLYFIPPQKIQGRAQPTWTHLIDQAKVFMGGASLDRTLDLNIRIGLRARMVP